MMKLGTGQFCEVANYLYKFELGIKNMSFTNTPTVGPIISRFFSCCVVEDYLQVVS